MHCINFLNENQLKRESAESRIDFESNRDPKNWNPVFPLLLYRPGELPCQGDLPPGQKKKINMLEISHLSIHL